MTPEDATAWSLARLNTLFFHHYDRREYDEVLDLFTPDARYEVHGQKLRGGTRDPRRTQRPCRPRTDGPPPQW